MIRKFKWGPWASGSLSGYTPNLDEYHDCFVKSDTLLLADVFKNFRKMCLKVSHLDPVKSISAPGLAWQEVLKNVKVKLGLLLDIDLLLMVEKGVRGEICHAIQLLD